jgi:hypothetical protein
MQNMAFVPNNPGTGTIPESHLIPELVADEINSGQTMIIEFDIGVIESPQYERVDLKGSLPLLGSYKQPDLTNLSKVEATVEERVRKLRVPWDDDEISGENSHTKVGILCAAYLNPANDVEESLMIAMSFFFLSINYMDDIFDRSRNFGGFSLSGTGKLSNRLIDHALRVFNGEFSSLSDIPVLIPALDPVLRLGFVSYEYAAKVIPNFGDTNSYLRKAFCRNAETGLLMKEKSFGDMYSDETYRMLRARDVGFHTALEMILLIRGVQLPKRVRKSVLFNVILDNAAGSLGLINDLLSLRKEIGEDAVDNLVLRKVQREKISLAVAFAQVNELAVRQMSDVALACKKFAAKFPEDDAVPLFIDVVESILNGHVYFAVFGKRYGDITIRIVPI